MSTPTLKQLRDELAPGVCGWLGSAAWIMADVATDSLIVASPWGGFVITRKAIEQGQEWKSEFMRQIRLLQDARLLAQAEGGDSNAQPQGAKGD